MRVRRAQWPMLMWLVSVWVALWGDLSFANVASGVLVGLVVLALFDPQDPRRSLRFRPVAAGRFLGYFFWKLVEASVVVSREVVTPRNRINEGIVAIPIRGVSDALVTLVANAISLTPGTLTIEVARQPTVLYVHVLHLHDIEAVRREVQHLEMLAIRAFGSSGEVAAVGVDVGSTSPLPSATTMAPRREGDRR